jgi:hypothetical protein
MKKRTFEKSLKLHRETLLALEDSQMQRALIAGGVTSACKSAWTCCDSNCTC